MRDLDLPSVPYDATAVRPDWSQLPDELRAAIAARLGTAVTGVTTAGAGFTSGFAAVLRLADGERVFVKAASLSSRPPLADWYAREAAVTALLPARVPAPRLRWSLTAGGYHAVCFDAVDGRPPALPWQPAQLDAALSAWADAAAALRRPPAELVALGLPGLPELLRADLSWWTASQAGRTGPVPAPAYARDRVGELAALEGALPAYAHSPGVIHCDLRLDNVVIDTTGAAWICDWNWPCHGPAWFDTASLLVSAYASGLDADRLFAEHPTAQDAPADALDATLAAMSGYWLVRSAAAPPTGSSPHMRDHQRFSGRTALAWLAARRGWS